MAKEKKFETVIVDGVEYFWRVHRWPQWCTADGYRGLALDVERSKGAGRSLILQFRMVFDDHHSTPHRQRPRPSAARIAECIRGALQAGWDPSSRGKEFVHEIQDPC